MMHSSASMVQRQRKENEAQPLKRKQVDFRILVPRIAGCTFLMCSVGLLTTQWITKSSRPAFLTSLDSPLDPLATRSAPFGSGPDGLNSPGQDRILEPRQRSEQIEGFPFTDQKSSPLATLQGNTDASIARLKAELDHLREGIERRDDRAGLSPHTSPKVTRGRDSIVCGIPGVADIATAMGANWCLHGVQNQTKSVTSRALDLRMGPPTVQDQEEAEEEEEEERLKRGAEAVDAAEDKMGNYWDPGEYSGYPGDAGYPATGEKQSTFFAPPPGFPKDSQPSWTQPKDMIVRAREGLAQETAWNKLKRLFSGIEEEIPSVDLGNVTWTWEWHPKVFCAQDDGWHWGEGANPGLRNRRYEDPTCDSDLTLHPVHAAQAELERPFRSPFRGTPIRNGPLKVGDVAPYLKGWGGIGEPKGEEKEVPWTWKSPFRGTPIRDGPLPVGDKVWWGPPAHHPSTDEKPYVWRSPFRGVPIGGVGGGVPQPPPPPPPPQDPPPPQENWRRIKQVPLKSPWWEKPHRRIVFPWDDDVALDRKDIRPWMYKSATQTLHKFEAHSSIEEDARNRRVNRKVNRWPRDTARFAGGKILYQTVLSEEAPGSSMHDLKQTRRSGGAGGRAGGIGGRTGGRGGSRAAWHPRRGQRRGIGSRSRGGGHSAGGWSLWPHLWGYVSGGGRGGGVIAARRGGVRTMASMLLRSSTLLHSEM